MPYVSVRRVLPHEYPKYRSHLKALDLESRTLRFGYPVTDYVIDNLCNKFEEDPSNHVLFAIENRKLEFIAIGHIALEQGMELAFSVLKKHQGRGFGNLLMKRCIQYCRTHNILNGNMVCMSSNSVIRHLCKKYGISIKNEQGESLANVELSPADMNTYISETIDNNISALDYITKRVIV